MAQQWQAQGAPRLHLIDLDGAAQGEVCHWGTIEQIVRSVNLPVQVGGGIRQLEAVAKLLEMGVARVILGTAAVAEPGLVKEICHRFGEAIVVSIDAREGKVATRGWQESTTTTAIELLRDMADSGVKRFIYTDISRDGTLTEPNFEAIAELVANSSLPIIAAGGISSLSQLKRLKEIGVEGAIVGRALYTRDIDLKQALIGLTD